MARIAVIADRDTAVYFRLAGIRDSYPVKDSQEAESKLIEIAQNTEIAVIIITERLAEEIQHVITKITEKRLYPLIISVPDKQGPIPRKIDPIAELIKRTVGVEIRVG
jgi:V/A-type H+-transporting ATPase subunit F